VKIKKLVFHRKQIIDTVIRLGQCGFVSIHIGFILECLPMRVQTAQIMTLEQCIGVYLYQIVADLILNEINADHVA
jgi:hypothetical protein